MNSIDDLRSTLETHATEFQDPGVLARASSVHHRVRAVRRRRRAAATAGLVGAVAVVGAVVLLPGGADQAGPAPAGPVSGIDVPQQLTALGYTYGSPQVTEGNDGKVRVDLPDSDLPRLVSWGTSGDDQRVTLDGPGFPRPLVYDVADFGDFYYVAEGSGESITIKAADGDPDVAVYTLGDARPDGTTRDGVTFRQSPAGYELLGAAFGRPGEADFAIAATAPSRGVALRYFCTGGPEGAWLHLKDADGEFSSGSGCSGSAPVDTFSAPGNDHATRVGEDVTTRFYVTDGPDGPRIDDPDLQLGFGIYARTDDLESTTLDGDFPETLERDGHVWRLVERQDAPGTGRVEAVAPAADEPVLAVTYISVGAGEVRSTVDGEGGTSGYSAGSGQTMFEQVPGGSLVRSEVTDGEVTDSDRLTVGFYVQAD